MRRTPFAVAIASGLLWTGTTLACGGHATTTTTLPAPVCADVDDVARACTAACTMACAPSRGEIVLRHRERCTPITRDRSRERCRRHEIVTKPTEVR